LLGQSERRIPLLEITHLLVFRALFASGGVSPVTPDSTGLPGIAGVHTILSWLMFVALSICGASAIVGGAALAYANHSARPDLAVRAKSGLLWALAGAFLIGIAIPLVNAFYGLG
jgi:hypothetical protein